MCLRGCWSTDPTDPTLSKNKKLILQNVGQLFFLIYYLLIFQTKKKEIKHKEHINNRNPINYHNQIIHLAFFFLCLLCKIIVLKKYQESNNIIFILPTD